VRAILEAVIVLALYEMGAAGTAPPAGWRNPTKAEAGQAWRSGSSHRYLAIRADFDGDGRTDEAKLLVTTAGPGAALVVLLGGSGQGPIILERFDDALWLDVMGIDLVKPGQYRTACGKGYWKCETGEPEVLVLDRPAIDLFKEGSANSYFFFDPATRRFRRVWISD